MGCGSNYALNLAWRPRTYLEDVQWRMGGAAELGAPAWERREQGGLRLARRWMTCWLPTYDDHYKVPHTVTGLRRPGLGHLHASPLSFQALRRSWWTSGAVSVGGPAAALNPAEHALIGIEPAPQMAQNAAARLSWAGSVSTSLCCVRPVEQVELAPGSVDAVLAMGSLQYTDDPASDIAARCGLDAHGRGRCACSSTSLQALVLELLAAGRHAEALERLEFASRDLAARRRRSRHASARLRLPCGRPPRTLASNDVECRRAARRRQRHMAARGSASRLLCRLWTGRWLPSGRLASRAGRRRPRLA